MKNKLSIFFIALFCLLGMTINVLSQTTANCNIFISTPSIDGASVQVGGEVSGTATIPNGCYLWVLVHRSLPYKRQGVWWPQSDADINSDRNWSSWVSYGQDIDVGHEFEIAIIVVNQVEHLRLQSYVNAGDWSRNIKMPPTICPPVIRTVRKN